MRHVIRKKLYEKVYCPKGAPSGRILLPESGFMSEQKKCKQCGEQFSVDNETLEFLKRISPTFDGRKINIASNKFCEECRHIRRMIWRNETHLYKRKCDLCSNEFLSMFSPDNPHTVYCLKCWWSDKWDWRDYALDYDPNKRFLNQVKELYLKVPQPGMTVTNSQNCDFCSNAVDSKNCYMMFSGRGEDCLYGRKVVDCRDAVDTLFTSNSENCYETIFCDNCYSSKYLHECRNCSNCAFLYDCVDCTDCFMSSNLRNTSYVFQNKQLAEKEYFTKLNEEWNGSRLKTDELYDEFTELITNSIHRENRNYKCEDCTGDHLTECKNCSECFEVLRAENCRRMYDSMGAPSADCMDCDHTPGGELNYETSSCYPIWNSAFSLLVYDGKDAYYSINCFNDNNSIFGCVSTKHADHVILNKEYSQEEYGKIVPEIIDSMIKDDDWGKFLPPEMCPFSYNESIANDYWPKTKGEAAKMGFSWNDKDYGMHFEGDFYNPKDNISEYNNKGVREKLLSGVLKCVRSGKPFKIIPQELAFYIKNNIPIPRIGYFERHKERMKFRNPRKLFLHKCDSCRKEIHTSYASDRPEKVYCESCYQKELI